MIVARLRIQTSPDGTKHLVGRTVCHWSHTPGTVVVLSRRGDEYELLELGPREGSRDKQAVLSFLPQEAVE